MALRGSLNGTAGRWRRLIGASLGASDGRARTGTINTSGQDGEILVAGVPVASGRSGSGSLVVKRVGWALLGLQLVGMLAFSTVQYSRFALTKDFATFSQAWWAIAGGHLDPWSSVLGIRFWRNDSEFALWALAPLHFIGIGPVLLLWVQDLAVVATELVAFGWILEILERSALSRRGAALVVVGAVVVMCADPWVYETIAFDLHITVFAGLFALLAGRDLWAGRTRRLWLWVPLALASEALGGLYLVGVGIAGLLAGRRTRLVGLLLVGIGVAWVSLLGALGGTGLGGHGVDRWYGYLVGPHHGHIGMVDIVLGALRHPGTALHLAGSRVNVVLTFLVVVGFVGIVVPWGLGPALVVFVPSMLNVNPSFLRPQASFQSWPALPFVLVASVMVLVWLVTSGSRRRVVGVAGTVVWAVLLADQALTALPTIPRYWIDVSAPAAARLAALARQAPTGTEVVASNEVIGRFGARPYVYALGSSPGSATFGAVRPIPVHGTRVLFVITPELDVNQLSVRQSDAALGYLEHSLHARVLVHADGVDALLWRPPPGTTHVF